MLVSPECAGPAHTALDFVEDKGTLVPVCRFTKECQEISGRGIYTAFALERFNENCGELMGGKEFFNGLDVIERREMETLDKRFESRMKLLLSRGAQSAVCPPVKTIDKRKNMVLIR